MKIRKIKWSNDSILGDLNIDVTKDHSTSYNTVIFAGDNGSGKTTILSKLATFLNLKDFDFEMIEYVADSGKVFEASKHPGHKSFYRIKSSDGQYIDKNADYNNDREKIKDDYDEIRKNGCVFSKARSDFQTKKISSVTSETLDNEKYSLDSKEDFTSLKQLLIDIETKDNEEYRRINRGNPTTLSEEEFYKSNSNMYRFKHAINEFFEYIKFDSIKTIDGAKEVVFVKNGKEIKIDTLSTGEKQIVFRGVYLLKNRDLLTGGTVLIDEPELSMHPKWQKKILKYYQNLFTINNNQMVQLFIATHSEYVLESALSDSDSLVVVLKQNSGSIIAHKITVPFVLPQVTSAEINYVAFDLYSVDYHIQLFNYVPDKLSLSNDAVTTIDAAISSHASYDPTIHNKPSSYTNPRNGNTTNYQTISAYIRNEIHHASRTYTHEDMVISTKLLIKISS